VRLLNYYSKKKNKCHNIFMREFYIDKNSDGTSLEKYVKKMLPNAPLSFIYKVFRQKDVRINGVRKDRKEIIHEGDKVAIYVSEQYFEEFTSTKEIEKRDDISKYIIYEDDNILLINKPRGMLVQKAEANDVSLNEMVLSYLYLKGEYDPNDNSSIPGPAHRLDRNTAGIVIFGKNNAVLRELNELLQRKSSVEKHYITLVKGKINKDGIVDAPIYKLLNKSHAFVDFEKGKEAKTEYHVLTSNDNYSLLDINLLTGRTHQIRVHMAYIEHPVIGDNKYGDFSLNKTIEKEYRFTNQFLEAYKLVFKKVDGPLSYLSNKTFKIDLGDEFKELLINLNLKVPPLV